MSSPTAAHNTISIDLLNDLKEGSHLRRLLEQENAVFAIASELAQYSGHPVAAAVGSAPARLTISAPANWKTATGIGFSLTPQASCTVAVAGTSTRFPIAKSIDSKDTDDIVCGPTAGTVYINIDLDFSINASVSGSGTVSGVGISGKASGCASATLSYCHAVDAATNTMDALKDAFSKLVFPLEPDCALVMGSGDVGRVSFDGSLGFGLDVSYGLGSYKFSAPGVDSVQKSLQKGFEKLTFPTVDLEAGAKASFAYQHTDHFGAIVQKQDAQTAMLYLVRSAADEVDGSAGISVGVSVTPAGATIDKNVLARAVNQVTGTGGALAAAVADQLQTSLANRANHWLCAQNGDAGLLVQLSRQTNRALLYKFQADLTKADLTSQSWKELAQGDVAAAAKTGGLTLEAGSGVGSELKKSVSVGLHFFNFFSLTDTTTYFQNSYTEIGPDGSIRFLFDIGNETDVKTKSALVTSRIHFVASATRADRENVQNVDVDLAIELSENNKVRDGDLIASAIGSLPPSGAVQPAQTAMRQFVAGNQKGTLRLVTVLKPAAYRRLSCSQFMGVRHDIPPAPPQEEDQGNWNAYRDAARTLLELNYVQNLTYADWVVFNQYCNTGSAKGTPNRRATGNPAAVPPSFYSDRHVGDSGLQVAYFLQSTALFMNLCDNLNALAGTIGNIDTLTGWNDLLKNLTGLAKDLQSDWTRAVARAVLQLCGTGATIQVSLQPGASAPAESLTCTVTLS